MTGIHVTTRINGDPVEYVCPADESLLDVLRDRVGLTGVKEGCGSARPRHRRRWWRRQRRR